MTITDIPTGLVVRKEAKKFRKLERSFNYLCGPFAPFCG